jgi:hypothetical protein
VAAGVLAVAVLYVAAEIADGPYLLADIMHKRAYRLADAFSQSGLYLLVFLPFFGISAAWVYRNHGCARRRPLVIGWLVAHAAGLVFSGGDGTGRNIFFEAIVLDAIIVVIAYHDLFSRKGVPVMSAALLLAAPMLFPLFLLPGEVSGSLREWQRLPVMQDDFAEGVGLLRGSSSPVLCENLLMCYQAGKQSAFDLYFVQDQIKTGRISEDGIVDLVASRRLAMVEIGDVDGPEPAARSRARFTGRFMQTLLKQYRVVLRTPEFTVLVPGDGPPLSPAVSISKKVVDAGLRRHDGL